ncbi:MAG: tyrosine-type recombinase/integrase, partial [Brevinema sp.]
GCRPSELISLHRKDIDTNGSVRIFQNKTKLKKTITIPAFLIKEMKQGYIFEGHNRQPEYYGKKFRKLRLKLGLSTEYSLYTFRHTFATNLLNKTSDIHLVSKALGHTNIMMTAKHYANRTSKDIQDRVSILWDNDKA